MDRLKLYIRISLLLIGVALVAEAQAYQIIDRFQLLEDKFRTQEMLRPLEHDFIFDITALANTDLLDFVDEADQVSKGESSTQLSRAQDFLRKYDKTEQNLRVGLNLGIPLFSFTAWGVKFKPSIRAQGNLGFLMGIRSTTITVNDAISYLGNDVPAEVKTALQSCNFSTPGLAANGDIVQYAITNCLSPAQDVLATPYLGKYFFPDTNTNVPDIYNYIKGEARVGLNFDYIWDEHFFGAFSLYGLGRADYSLRVSAQTLANNSDALELPDDLNTTVNMAMDYRLGYRNGNLTGFVAFEDVKLARMSDEEETAGQLFYGEDMLIRLHGEYLYKLSFFSVKAFGGVHKRSSYGLGDGYYLGGDFGAHVWEDRVGLRMRGMIDSEHLTISPMIKLWLVHLEYMLKQPIKSEVDGVKPSTIHSLNLRISI